MGEARDVRLTSLPRAGVPSSSKVYKSNGHACVRERVPYPARACMANACGLFCGPSQLCVGAVVKQIACTLLQGQRVGRASSSEAWALPSTTRRRAPRRYYRENELRMKEGEFAWAKRGGVDGDLLCHWEPALAGRAALRYVCTLSGQGTNFLSILLNAAQAEEDGIDHSLIIQADAAQHSIKGSGVRSE
jgi:hypothetical protein